MKKTYIIPSLEVICIQTRKMLATSAPSLGGDYSGTDPVLAPDFLFDE